MQARPFLVILAAALAVASAAAGQPKPRRRPPPPRPPAEGVVAPAKRQTPVAPVPLKLGGLPNVGDPAPACRAQCSKDRYVCHAAGDATDCDSRWIPCLRACSAP